jgi:hypothetical protein
MTPTAGSQLEWNRSVAGSRRIHENLFAVPVPYRADTMS